MLYTDVLLKNLTPNSFKTKLKQPPQPSKDDIKQYLNTNQGEYASTRSIYKNMFNEPVKLLFYWTMDDYQGPGIVIYKLHNMFIFSRFSFA